MSVQNPYKAYEQNSVIQSTPAELTLMLYNGCIKFLNQAKKGIEAGNVEQKNINLQKAQNILRELSVTLDMSIPLSESLLSLYDYLMNRLIEANIKNDLTIIQEVEEFVLDFRDTWKQVIQMDRQQKYGESGGI